LLRLDLLKSELECIEETRKHRNLAFSNVLYTNKTETDVGENVNGTVGSNGEDSTNPRISILKLKRSKSRSHGRQMKLHRFSKLNDLKLAFSEFYLMLILLKDYQTLNYTGFCKILKKHDKLFETERGYEWR
jgi:hypothetical protein